MRIKKTATVLALGLVLALSSQTGVIPAYASSCSFSTTTENVFVDVEKEGLTYKVGEAFRADEVSLGVGMNRSCQYYKGNALTFIASGNTITNGYRFKEPGKKNVVVKYGNYQGQYTLNVVPDLNGTLKECSVIVAPAKLTYRQSVEPFNPDDIIVRCVFKDGTTQDIDYRSLEFIAGGNPIKKGYRFKEPGTKDLVIRLGEYETNYSLTVTPTTTGKTVASCEVTTDPEPSARNYRVGQGFHTCEYSARNYYTDGTYEDFSGNQLDITANGVQMYEGYHFQEAGQKKIVVTLGDYTTDYTLTVNP